MFPRSSTRALLYGGRMEDLQSDPRPCVHCGGAISAVDMTCANCGRAYIPDPPVDDVPPLGDPKVTDQLPPPPGDLAPTDGPGTEAPYGVPATVPADSRNWAMAAHGTALAGALLGGLAAFVGPLVIWLLRREQRDPFATEHARQALNFNLSVIIYAVAAVVLSIVTLGLGLLLVLPLGALAFVGYVVVTIRATMAASRGEAYHYPFTISLVT
jgi:uncharacterized Tic20 family protein